MTDQNANKSNGSVGDAGKSDASGFTFLGVRFAPLSLPLERRLQTFAVAFVMWAVALMGANFATAFVLLLTLTDWWWPRLALAAYAAWMVYDWDIGERGGRKWLWLRYVRLWRYYQQYFPITICRVPTTLDPSAHSYVFAAHPHGVLSLGIFGTFAVDGSDMSSFLPGFDVRVATLPIQFHVPFSRELVAASGCISSTKACLERQLRKEPGHITVIVVGGASEAVLYSPDKINLYLKKRKGFVKLALKHGRPLVPVFVFGETFIFNQAATKEGTALWRFQQWFQNAASFSLPMFYGRGLFQYSFGFLPHRRPMNIVIGDPIPVEKTDGEPTAEQVDALHAVYCRELASLYDEYNPKYGSPDVSLAML